MGMLPINNAEGSPAPAVFRGWVASEIDLAYILQHILGLAILADLNVRSCGSKLDRSAYLTSNQEARSLASPGARQKTNASDASKTSLDDGEAAADFQMTNNVLMCCFWRSSVRLGAFQGLEIRDSLEAGACPGTLRGLRSARMKSKSVSALKSMRMSRSTVARVLESKCGGRTQDLVR